MSEQQAYNAGDANQVAKAQGKAKIREHLRKTGLRKIMNDPEGRAWMWGTLEACGVFRLSFSTDIATMAFREGNRDIGNRVIAEIYALSPELYLKMAMENTKKGSEE